MSIYEIIIKSIICLHSFLIPKNARVLLPSPPRFSVWSTLNQCLVSSCRRFISLSLPFSSFKNPLKCVPCLMSTLYQFHSLSIYRIIIKSINCLHLFLISKNANFLTTVMARMTALNPLVRKTTLLVERANKMNVYLTIRHYRGVRI